MASWTTIELKSKRGPTYYCHNRVFKLTIQGIITMMLFMLSWTVNWDLVYRARSGIRAHVTCFRSPILHHLCLIVMRRVGAIHIFFQTFKFFEWDENDWERKTAWNQIFEFFFGQSKYWNNFWNFVLVPGNGALDPVDVVWDLGVHPWVVRPGTAQAPADNSDLSLQCRHSEIKGLASFLPPDC